MQRVAQDQVGPELREVVVADRRGPLHGPEEGGRPLGRRVARPAPRGRLQPLGQEVRARLVQELDQEPHREGAPETALELAEPLEEQEGDPAPQRPARRLVAEARGRLEPALRELPCADALDEESGLGVHVARRGGALEGTALVVHVGG